MKKLFAALLVAVMLFSLTPIFNANAKAVKSSYVHTDVTVANGQVMFYLYFDNYDEVSSSITEFTYDANVLQYKTLKRSGDFGLVNTNGTEAGKVLVATAATQSWTDLDEDEPDSRWFRLTFTVLDDTCKSTTINAAITEALLIDTVSISELQGTRVSESFSTIPAVTHTVTFVDGLTNDVISTTTVLDGENVSTFPSAPSHVGYTFKGWSSDGTNITSDVTIKALYDQSVYTVTFVDTVSNTVITTVQVTHGTNVTNFPTAPTHEGYTFSRWSSDGTNVQYNMTINAIYTKNIYTVTFVDGVNNQIMLTAQAEHGATVTLPTPLTHNSYAFSHWDHTGVNITSNVTITARYDVTRPGDVNDDGELNTGDAVITLQYCVATTDLTEDQLKSADLNNDGTVNTGDAVTALIACVS